MQNAEYVIFSGVLGYGGGTGIREGRRRVGSILLIPAGISKLGPCTCRFFIARCQAGSDVEQDQNTECGARTHWTGLGSGGFWHGRGKRNLARLGLGIGQRGTRKPPNSTRLSTCSQGCHFTLLSLAYTFCLSTPQGSIV